MNAEKIYEDAERKSKLAPPNTQQAEAAKTSLDAAKKSMEEAHTAMHFNLLQYKAYEKKVQAEEGGSTKFKYMKKLVKEWFFHFEELKPVLLKAHPLRFEGAKKGLRDETADLAWELGAQQDFDSWVGFS